MAHELVPGDTVWSNETYHLSEVLNRVEFPTAVRVSHGYYSSYDIETFSNGDLLHMKKCVTLQKVSAQFVQRIQSSKTTSSLKTIGEEVLIPLSFKGPIKLINDSQAKTKFHSVQELIDAFPRFVKNEKEIEGICGKRGTRRIKEGRQLQLIRLLPGTLRRNKKSSDQLVCIYENKEIALSATTKGRFSLLPDDTTYTLASLIDTLPLPRYVIFVDNETGHAERSYTEDISGSIALLHAIVLQKMIVAYHEPAGIEISQHGPDGVISLPLDNHAVKELEVNILRDGNTETADHVTSETIRDILDRDCFAEWLYVERAQNPKVRYLFDDFPASRAKMKRNWSIDDTSSKSFMTKSSTGSQDGWSSSEFSLCSQDILLQSGSVYDTVGDVSSPQESPRTGTEPQYEELKDNKSNGSSNASGVKLSDHNDASKKAEVRTGYINMPFYRSPNQNIQEGGYRDVKIPPPKPPRKDKTLKRIFAVKAETNKTRTIPVHPEPPNNQQTRPTISVGLSGLEWNKNPIYSDLEELRESHPVEYRKQVQDSVRPKSFHASSQNYTENEHGQEKRRCSVGSLEKEFGDNQRTEVVTGKITEIDSEPVKSVTPKSITETLDECFKILAEVCEMEEQMNRECSEGTDNPKVTQSHIAKTENDIGKIIEYCNAVSKTFNEMKIKRTRQNQLSKTVSDATKDKETS